MTNDRPDLARLRPVPTVVGVLVASALALAACVTSGGDSGGGLTAFGTVAVVSGIAAEAGQGEARAKALWCGSLGQVEAALMARPDHTDDTLVADLTQPVFDLARENRYQLHPQQLRLLILDARHVLADKSASPQAKAACAPAAAK